MKKTLSITLGVVLVCAIGALVYIIAMPKVGEKLTEFYVLGPWGKAENYPSEVVLGEEAKVIVGIVNRERQVTAYRLEVVISGIKNNEVGTVTLENGEKWEEIVSFTPDKAGDNQKVEFLLYRLYYIEHIDYIDRLYRVYRHVYVPGWDEVYQRLHLWVDVQ